MFHTILWSRADGSGHESARLIEPGRLGGTSVFEHDGAPVRLDYHIECNDGWITRSASVRGWIGSQTVAVDIDVRDGQWRLNGSPFSACAGCIDVDLNFSPATNLLPIRRLQLEIGDRATVRAAWLRFPSMKLEVLEQSYERISADVFRYESAGGKFKADLKVDACGFPIDYPGGWRSERGCTS